MKGLFECNGVGVLGVGVLGAVVFCRGNLGQCGKEGRLFEKKEITATSLPWWKKVLKFIKGVKE